MSETKPEKKAKPKSSELYRKIEGPAAKVLLSLKERANKKSFGRQVRDSEIIAFALSLVEEKHLKLLQDCTLSNRDRLQMSHEEYCKSQSSKLSLDEFIGKLMRGDIKLEEKKTVESGAIHA